VLPPSTFMAHEPQMPAYGRAEVGQLESKKKHWKLEFAMRPLVAYLHGRIGGR
jgi:hypothetical protein